MTRFFLGADLGATKSHLLIADEDGRAVAFAAGGNANHEVVGFDRVTVVFRDLLSEALGTAGIGLDRIAGAGLGISGFDWPSERPAHDEALVAAGLTGIPVEIVNDAVVGLLAGAADGWGVGLVAGTGCNCWGISPDGRYGRVLGLGNRVGEFAGGSALVERAVWAVARAWTRRGPETALTDAFVRWARVRDADDFLESYCERRLVVPSSLAPMVFDVAAAADEVAVECVAWAGRELADLAVGVIRQLRLEALPFDLVLIGSLFNGGDLLTGPMRAAIHDVAPLARPVRLTTPPVLGGVVLAMARAHVDVRDRYGPLVATTRAIRPEGTGQLPDGRDVIELPIPT
ncbi:MAG TPA: BadF/BadG/BcrA/BcrD ATPase family protein [Candidatus Limnocylindrales bacterium]|nr:BadF/BadG/BcrA/BcrD ATPase family protein [Candidatus Limnocylindrales bacterium]